MKIFEEFKTYIEEEVQDKGKGRVE